MVPPGVTAAQDDLLCSRRWFDCRTATHQTSDDGVRVNPVLASKLIDLLGFRADVRRDVAISSKLLHDLVGMNGVGAKGCEGGGGVAAVEGLDVTLNDEHGCPVARVIAAAA